MSATSTNSGAADIYPAKKGELRTFWQERLSRQRLHFALERNIKHTRWQTPFEVKEGSLHVGGQRFTGADERFPSQMGSCQVVAGSGFFKRSEVKFCRSQKTPAAIQVAVNGSQVGALGQVGLSSESAVLLAVTWPSGAELQFHLWAPQDPSVELLRVLPEAWDLVEASGAEYEMPPAVSGDFSFPHRLPSKVTRIERVPFNQTLKGPLDIQFVRVGTELPESGVPSQSELPGLGSSYGLSCSSPEVRTTLMSSGKAEQDLVFKGVELGNQDFEFEFNGRYYQTSITRVPKVELSLRASGLISSENAFMLSGEAAVLFHPGHLWGERMESLDAQRFGFRARGFGALMSFQGLMPAAADPLEFWSGEGRVMLKRGAWNLDEVYGVLLSYNQFKLFADQRAYTGLGFFWGRPLPRILTWLKYPQYVDLDVSSLQPLETGRGVTSGFSANFHGKVLFPKDWFAEAGVGVMNVGAGTSNLQMVIGTVGGGWMF